MALTGPSKKMCYQWVGSHYSAPIVHSRHSSEHYVTFLPSHRSEAGIAPPDFIYEVLTIAADVRVLTECKNEWIDRYMRKKMMQSLALPKRAFSWWTDYKGRIYSILNCWSLLHCDHNRLPFIMCEGNTLASILLQISSRIHTVCYREWWMGEIE